MDFGRDFSSPWRGREELAKEAREGRRFVSYFALFADAALGGGFFRLEVGGLGDCHGHVVIFFVGWVGSGGEKGFYVRHYEGVVWSMRVSR